MKRGVCIVVFILILLTSCAHLSPFYNKEPYLSTLNPNGNILFSQKIDFDLDVSNVSFERITVSYNPNNQSYFGALEGNFSKLKANYFIKHKYKGSLSLACPDNGIILFSSSSLKEVLDNYKNCQVILDKDIYSELINSYSGFYTENPTELLNVGFSTDNISFEKIYSIKSISNGISSDFVFELKDKKDCNSLLTIIKTAVGSEIRKKGNKIDIEYLNTIISTEGNKVYLLNQDFTFDISSFLNF